MIKKLAQTILLSAAALASSGCMVNYGQHREDRSGFYVQPEVTSGIEYCHWKAKHGRNGTTLPPHPGDAGFLSGTTTTDSPKGDSFSPKIGAGVSGGTKYLRMVAGVDLRHNLNEGSRGAGIYEERNQSSDTRPESGNSRQYTQDLFKPVTLIPRLGLETQLGDFVFYAEISKPYSEIKTETGHMRFGKMDKVRDDTWKGFGKLGYGGSITYKLDDSVRIGLYLRKEEYEAEFFGERASIDGLVGGLVLDWDFW